MTAGKEVELPIARIAQLARAVGIHMIIATQRPTTSIITGNIKANFPGRIAFKVTSAIDSKTILDRTGANQLIGRGDMLYLCGNEPVRVQCAFVDTPKSSASTSISANSLALSNLWSCQNQLMMKEAQVEAAASVPANWIRSSKRQPMRLFFHSRVLPA